LNKRLHAIVEADLFEDLSVFELQHRDAGKVHLTTGVGGQAAGEEVFERRTRVGAAALPLADDVVALGDEVCSTPEVQVRERGAEVFS